MGREGEEGSEEGYEREGMGREGEEGSEEGYERGRGISRLDLTAGATPYPARHTNIMGWGRGRL